MTQLFKLLARPLGTPSTPGVFLLGLRVMAVDGTVLDVPDTPANAKVFGYPGSRKGTRAAFPKIRLVLLIEAGTHLIVDALMCPYRMGERVRAKQLLHFLIIIYLLDYIFGILATEEPYNSVRSIVHFYSATVILTQTPLINFLLKFLFVFAIVYACSTRFNRAISKYP
jgi:hypothetical protein